MFRYYLYQCTNDMIFSISTDTDNHPQPNFISANTDKLPIQNFLYQPIQKTEMMSYYQNNLFLKKDGTSF